MCCNSNDYKFADLKEECNKSIDQLEKQITNQCGKETVLIAYTKC